MEERIEEINREENQKKRDVERFWDQLKKNGYSEDDRKKEKNVTKRREKEMKVKREK